MEVSSTFFSLSVRHEAPRICDFSSAQVTPHNRMENPPSMRNIHCQPCNPKPRIESSPPVIGPESTDASAEPARNTATALPRSFSGSHWVEEKTPPGKKPASAT